jgi:malonyl-CoA O-methyltransferase
MTSIADMTSSRSRTIAERFGACAADYERQADVQRHVAARLAQDLPPLKRPRVLELGCGTGLFSRHLLRAYPKGRFLFSDLSPQMLAECRRNLDGLAGRDAAFALIDAERDLDPGSFDLIATSMTLHWLERPEKVLARLRRRLAPGGSLVFSALGPLCFSEWQAVFRAENLPSGLVAAPALPGVYYEERLTAEATGMAFLHRLKAIGGLTAAPDYSPLPPGALRRALRRLDADFGGRLTWHIVYGRLSPMESSLAASRSRPSVMPL